MQSLVYKSFDCCKNGPLKNRSVAWKPLSDCDYVWSSGRRRPLRDQSVRPTIYDEASSHLHLHEMRRQSHNWYKTEHKAVLLDQRNNRLGNNELYKAIVAYLYCAQKAGGCQ